MLEGQEELTVKLTVYSEDFLRLQNKVCVSGITFEELLEHFIGDLADGKASSGSDESLLASEWYRRHVFFWPEKKKSFVQYLADGAWTSPSHVGDLLQNIDISMLVLARCEKEGDEEGVDDCKEEILADMREIIGLYGEYRSSCEDCEELHQALNGVAEFAINECRMRGLAWEGIEFTQEFWDRFDKYVQMCEETEGDVR